MSQPEWTFLKGPKQINADTNSVVDAAMANIDAEYEALVASSLSLVQGVWGLTQTL